MSFQIAVYHLNNQPSFASVCWVAPAEKNSLQTNCFKRLFRTSTDLPQTFILLTKYWSLGLCQGVSGPLPGCLNALSGLSVAVEGRHDPANSRLCSDVLQSPHHSLILSTCVCLARHCFNMLHSLQHCHHLIWVQKPCSFLAVCLDPPCFQ